MIGIEGSELEIKKVYINMIVSTSGIMAPLEKVSFFFLPAGDGLRDVIS